MSDGTEAIVARCLVERREGAISGLLSALEGIAASGPEQPPKPQPGSDHDPLLAYEDGHADAAYLAAVLARAALEEWKACPVLLLPGSKYHLETMG